MPIFVFDFCEFIGMLTTVIIMIIMVKNFNEKEQNKDE